MEASQLKGWIPIDVYRRDNALTVDWIPPGDVRFTEPFFEDTVWRCLRHPFNVLFRRQTPAEMLARFQEIEAGIPPGGFIFHLSRCGSTLISQMLAALPRNVVISEAPPVDAILGAGLTASAVSDEERVAMLRGLLNALGQRRFGEERSLFVKFDCWHVLDLPTVHRAFPEVPWTFVYRHPLEVLASHRRIRGSQMVPGLIPPERFGFRPDEIEGLTLDRYGIRVLEKILRAVLQYRGIGNGSLIHYSQLPDAVFTRLDPAWKLELTEEEKAKVREVTAHHAKNPSQPFQKSDPGTGEIDANTRNEVEDRLLPLYEELETIRAHRQ